MNNVDTDTFAAGGSFVGGGSTLGNSLMSMLCAHDIFPGDEPSYQLCKTLYLYHPLGQKMAESPVTYAMSQEREVEVQDAPNEVTEQFEKQWSETKANDHIKAAKVLSRIYGISTLIFDTVESYEKQLTAEPLNMEKIHEQQMFISEWDPLNTAGSLVTNQIPISPDYQKVIHVRSTGREYHRSRCVVTMNEMPIYLAWTSSAFGFTGRSVYQRALFPLKSFIQSMIADDMIATKLGLMIAKMKSPGSIINGIMQRIAGSKRALLKVAKTRQVLEIDIEEAIETLDMSNVEGAGGFARSNILKNTATSGDMPAWFLENEAMRDGLSEGSEDAKNVARYIERIREEMHPLYQHMDMICQYRAWNPEFIEHIKQEYPEQYGKKTPEEIFSEWKQNFTAVWPSFLIEPESEKIEVEKVKLEGIMAAVQTFMQMIDPTNQAKLIQWSVDNLNECKLLFKHEFDLDITDLEAFREEQQKNQEENERAQIEAMAQGAKAMGGGKGAGGAGGGKSPGGVGAKPGAGGGQVAQKLGKFGG